MTSPDPTRVKTEAGWRELASTEAAMTDGVLYEIRWPTDDMPTPAP